MAENLPDTNVGNIGYIRKADVLKLLEETEKELAKDTDKYSIAYNFIVSVMGIVKCKIMQMEEKKDG